MPVGLYFDHHVSRVISTALRLRGVDVLTAFEDGAQEMPDTALLDRAGQLGRVLYSWDRDLLIEAERRQSSGVSFAGVIYSRPRRISIGEAVRDLELIAKASDPDDHRNQVTYLPL